MEVEEGPPIVKAASDKRSYKLIKLRNGLGVLLIYDPDVADDAPEDCEEDEPEESMDHMECCDGACSEQEPYFRFDWPQLQTNNCSGTSLLSIALFATHIHADSATWRLNFYR